MFSNNYEYGIFIKGTSKHFVIQNCEIIGCKYGIVVSSDTANIINNRCSNNEEYGILIDFTQNCRIEDNFCKENKIGLRLHYAGNSKIIRNYFENNIYSGMDTWGGCSSLTINDNVFYKD